MAGALPGGLVDELADVEEYLGVFLHVGFFFALAAAAIAVLRGLNKEEGVWISHTQ